jgi:hypothetical protein
VRAASRVFFIAIIVVVLVICLRHVRSLRVVVIMVCGFFRELSRLSLPCMLRMEDGRLGVGCWW